MRSRPVPDCRAGGFTLLEVALIVAIIGMMLMMIVGYFIAPKDGAMAPPSQARPKLAPALGQPLIRDLPPPESTPAPATPAASPTPGVPPAFR